MKIQIALISAAALALTAAAAFADKAPAKPECCQTQSACCASSACCTAAAQKRSRETCSGAVSGKPGKCSKCGMNLVPVQPK